MGISWIKERNGLYSCDGWTVSRRPDPDTINAPSYQISFRGREQGKAHTLRDALTKAGLMFGNIEEARLAAIGPFLTRKQVDALASAVGSRVSA